MSEPRSPRAVKSREKLLSAATALLVEFGPRGVTVDAVAESSGVAKSTLYRHWPSRDELLVDVVRCSVPAAQMPDMDGSFESTLRSYLSGAADALADPEWSRIVPALMSLRHTMPDLELVAEEDRVEREALLGEILDKGVSEGMLPPGIDPGDALSVLIGPLLFTTLSAETVLDRARLDRLVDYVVDRFLASYRT